MSRRVDRRPEEHPDERPPSTKSRVRPPRLRCRERVGQVTRAGPSTPWSTARCPTDPSGRATAPKEEARVLPPARRTGPSRLFTSPSSALRVRRGITPGEGSHQGGRDAADSALSRRERPSDGPAPGWVPPGSPALLRKPVIFAAGQGVPRGPTLAARSRHAMSGPQRPGRRRRRQRRVSRPTRLVLRPRPRVAPPPGSRPDVPLVGTRGKERSRRSRLVAGRVVAGRLVAGRTPTSWTSVTTRARPPPPTRSTPRSAGRQGLT